MCYFGAKFPHKTCSPGAIFTMFKAPCSGLLLDAVDFSSLFSTCKKSLETEADGHKLLHTMN